MKYALCLSALLLLNVYVLSAQSITLGVHGGISIPQLSSKSGNEVSEGYQSRLAPVTGALIDFGIGKQAAIRVLINYAGQGGKRSGLQPVTSIPAQLALFLPPGTKLYASFDNESILNYLEIPVLLKLEWGSNLHYYVNAGPYAGFLLSAKQKTSGNSAFYFDKAGTMPLTVSGQPFPAQSFDATTDVKDDLKGFNFGVSGGGGISYFLVKKHQLFLDIRAAYGLIPVQKETDKNGKSNTGGLFFSLGYAYRIHG